MHVGTNKSEREGTNDIVKKYRRIIQEDRADTFNSLKWEGERERRRVEES